VPFNYIDYFRTFVLPTVTRGGPDIGGEYYHHTWYIKIVLRDPQEEMDLFNWVESVAKKEFMIFRKSTKAAAACDAVLNRLRQLTGAKIQYG
jgi:hypothetical protein